MYLTILQRKGPRVKFFLRLKHFFCGHKHLLPGSLFMNWFIFTGIGVMRTVRSHSARQFNRVESRDCATAAARVPHQPSATAPPGATAVRLGNPLSAHIASAG